MASLTEVTAPYSFELKEQASPNDDFPDLLSNLTLRSALSALLQEAMPRLPSRSSPLDGVDWLQQLAADTEDYQCVLDRKGLTSKGGLFAEDHLFKAMARNGMLHDNRVLFAAQTGSHGRVYNAYALAQDVCGHKGVVHGGFSSAIIDETFGYVLYLVHQAHKLPELNLLTAMTAHLEIDYKKPLRANSTVVCIAEISSVEGRKLWLKAELLDRPYGTVFATGKALFVIPRPKEEPQQPKQEQAEQQRPAEATEGTEADV